MAQDVYSILTEEDTEAVEKYGSLSGTDKQMSVIEAAVESPEAEPGDLADQLDANEGYIRNVLRRAEDGLVQQVESGEAETSPDPDDADGSAEADDGEAGSPAEGEGEPVPESGRPAVFDPEEAEPTAVWHGEGIGELVEVSALEFCDECRARHPVTYLVPASEIGYMMEPQCGHGGRYRDAGEGTNEGVQRVIDALKRRVGT